MVARLTTLTAYARPLVSLVIVATLAALALVWVALCLIATALAAVVE